METSIQLVDVEDVAKLVAYIALSPLGGGGGYCPTHAKVQYDLKLQARHRLTSFKHAIHTTLCLSIRDLLSASIKTLMKIGRGKPAR